MAARAPHPVAGYVACLVAVLSIGSKGAHGLRIVSVGVAAVTAVAVIVPWFVNQLSNCQA